MIGREGTHTQAQTTTLIAFETDMAVILSTVKDTACLSVYGGATYPI